MWAGEGFTEMGGRRLDSQSLAEGAVGRPGTLSANSGQVCLLIQPLGKHNGGWGEDR